MLLISYFKHENKLGFWEEIFENYFTQIKIVYTDATNRRKATRQGIFSRVLWCSCARLARDKDQGDAYHIPWKNSLVNLIRFVLNHLKINKQGYNWSQILWEEIRNNLWLLAPYSLRLHLQSGKLPYKYLMNAHEYWNYFIYLLEYYRYPQNISITQTTSCNRHNEFILLCI